MADDDTGFTDIHIPAKTIDKLGLNEIVQLFNILKGDMSFIGPRPFIKGEALPSGKISKKRYMVKPGITGLAQVSGGVNLSHKDKLKYDDIYYDNFGFVQDLKIILKTPVSMINSFKNK